jgi:hypothetical protein
MPLPRQFSPADVKTLNTSIKNSFLTGSAKLLSKAPAGIDAAQSFEVTAPGLRGTNPRGFVVQGNLYLRQDSMAAVFPAQFTWMSCGKAPNI